MKGETLLTRKPQRIATTNFVAAEHLLTLGVAPIASTSLSALESFPIYQSELSRHSIIDLSVTLNEERLAAVSPDLIISFDWDRSDYAKLSAIAPTVVFGNKDEPRLFETYFNPVAEAAGEIAAKDAFITRYESAKLEAKACLAQAAVKGSTAIFLMASDTTIYVYTGWTTRTYYEEFGLVPCLGLKGKTVIQWEDLLRFDPDILFVAKMYLGEEGHRLALKDKPAWHSLKAVKERRVYETDASIMGPVAKGQMHGITFIKDMLQRKDNR
ncbi:unnamed protein product [Aphanomyces euteiches]